MDNLNKKEGPEIQESRVRSNSERRRKMKARRGEKAEAEGGHDVVEDMEAVVALDVSSQESQELNPKQTKFMTVSQLDEKRKDEHSPTVLLAPVVSSSDEENMTDEEAGSKPKGLVQDGVDDKKEVDVKEKVEGEVNTTSEDKSRSLSLGRQRKAHEPKN